MGRGERRHHVAIAFADHSRLGGMAGGKFGRRRRGTHDFRQFFDFDCDQITGVFGAVGIRRKDNRQRLADIANIIFGKDRLPVRLKALNPRQAEIDRRDIGDIGPRP